MGWILVCLLYEAPIESIFLLLLSRYASFSSLLQPWCSRNDNNTLSLYYIRRWTVADEGVARLPHVWSNFMSNFHRKDEIAQRWYNDPYE